jgi:hypothetical protein
MGGMHWCLPFLEKKVSLPATSRRLTPKASGSAPPTLCCSQLVEWNEMHNLKNN